MERNKPGWFRSGASAVSRFPVQGSALCVGSRSTVATVVPAHALFMRKHLQTARTGGIIGAVLVAADVGLWLVRESSGIGPEACVSLWRCQQ